MAFRKQSLRRRLLMAAALLLLVFLGVMGVGLNRAFEQSVLSNAEDNLRNQILLLMSNIDIIDDQIVVSEALLEPRLVQADSDLFAQIIRQEQGVVWRSPSLLEADMPILSGQMGDFQFFPEFNWLTQPPAFATTLNIEWETDRGDLPFTIQVSERSNSYDNRVEQYRRQIFTWLAIMGSSLLALLLLLLSWALRPLGRVTHQVAEIEQGLRQRFDEDYPSEVGRLTQNLNQLLSVEEQRINRQKEVLGNLAHSLKTPIAVLRGIEYGDVNKEEVATQLGSIQNIIDYQLQSASTVGRRRFSKAILVEPLTRKVVDSLCKLYADKSLELQVNIQSDSSFYGDEGDWMELCGNLLENAFKWADSEVSIKVLNQAQDSARKITKLQISDDGPGIEDHRKESILRRGVRLDSQTPGHGLGLNIVKGIVDAYDGKLEISDRQPKGTTISVILT